MSLNEFIPTSDGGTRFGSSFITSFWQCPMMWANTYVRPHPTEGGRGMEPTTKGDALILGSLVHEGLEFLYDYDMELGGALEAMALASDSLKLQFESAEVRDKINEQSRKILTRYFEWYGPGGRFPDDTTKVLAVEKTIEVPLGYKDFIFTSKPDVIRQDDDGLLETLEHKTTAASALWSLKAKMAVGIQPAMEIMAMQHAYPDADISGVRVNAIVKDRGAKSALPHFDRAELVMHNDESLAKYRHDIIMTLHEMEDLIQIYKDSLEMGWDEPTAAWHCFAKHRNECVGFGRCRFYAPCRQPEMETALLGGGFIPREAR